MLKHLYYTIKHGFYDDDPATTIFEELLVEYFGVVKGPYAKAINNILKQHGGICQITGKPNFALGVHINRSDGNVWTIRTQPGAKSDFVINLADEIEEALSRVNCFRHVVIQSKPLRVVLYHKQPRAVLLNDWLQEIDSLEKNKFLLSPAIHWKGRKEALVVFDMMAEKFCHMLVAGVTGSGKSQLLLSMILSLAIANDPQHCSVLVVDPKGIDFARSDIAKLPHLATKPIVDLDEAEAAIKAVRKELDRRMAKGDFAQAKKGIFIFCDEIASLTEHSDEAIKDLTAIARLGRAWNIHLIAATQRPTSKSIDTTLRSQLVCNLTGSVTSPEEAKYASGHAESGADRLPGKGAFILNAPQYYNHRVQGLLAADYGFVVDAILNEYQGQQPHFTLLNSKTNAQEGQNERFYSGVVSNVIEGENVESRAIGEVTGQENTVAESDNDKATVPSFVVGRESLVDDLKQRLASGEELNNNRVRTLHNQFYGKGINGDKANQLLDYVQNTAQTSS